jgi:dihydropteroate synthase
VEAGVKMINDVSGGKDLRMLELIASNPQVNYICMYSLTVPADKSVRIKGCNEVYDWFDKTVVRLTKAGIRNDKIILDPGIGFTTNPKQSFEIIQNVHKLREFGVAVMVGHSRKSYLEDITQLTPEERDLETTVASLHMYGKVDYLRVHNPGMHKRAFTAWREINS